MVPDAAHDDEQQPQFHQKTMNKWFISLLPPLHHPEPTYWFLTDYVWRWRRRCWPKFKSNAINPNRRNVAWIMHSDLQNIWIISNIWNISIQLLDLSTICKHFMCEVEQPLSLVAATFFHYPLFFAIKAVNIIKRRFSFLGRYYCPLPVKTTGEIQSLWLDRGRMQSAWAVVAPVSFESQKPRPTSAVFRPTKNKKKHRVKVPTCNCVEAEKLSISFLLVIFLFTQLTHLSLFLFIFLAFTRYILICRVLLDYNRSRNLW